MLSSFAGQRVVLLQGPMGPFFHRLGRELSTVGAKVTKVHFNAGDELFYRGDDVVRFTDKPENWASAFRALLQARRAQAVFLFGDSRPIHVVAVRVAKELGIDVYVFEEGYLRPDCITLEKGGVNKNSSMPRRLQDYPSDADAPTLASVGNTFWRMAAFACCYSLALTFLRWRYPHYEHHKSLNAFYQAFTAFRSFVRRALCAIREAPVLRKLESRFSGRFVLVALQVHDDFQIKNSRFAEVPDFIREVVRSFAQHAPRDLRLVFKHHPLDRGYKDYRPLLEALARTHGLGERLIYVHDLHLPTLLRHARACIVLNSTVGFSALFHGTPVKVLDDAVYDIPGLTVDLPLDEIWTKPLSVDFGAYRRVRAFMLRENQANGSFYRRLSGTGPSGIAWLGKLSGEAPVERSPELSGADRESPSVRLRHRGDVVSESQSPVSS
jgi:capsule polysaccharide modification protein KpsS